MFQVGNTHFPFHPGRNISSLWDYEKEFKDSPQRREERKENLCLNIRPFCELCVFAVNFLLYLDRNGHERQHEHDHGQHAE